jgi:hypothetical protein
VARPQGKAQPPTVADVGGGRYVRVYNTESVAVPPYAALEVIGYDKADNLFSVCRPTVSGRNDCLFNSKTAIKAGGTGQAVAPGGESLALYAPDGNTPAPGQIWGTLAGSWALTPRSTGYVVRFLASANRSALVVAPAPASLEEYVKITGVSPGGAVLPSYYPGVVVKLDIASDAYVDSVVSCWWRDTYREAPDVGEIIRSGHSGNGGPASDYRPLYVGRTESGDAAGSSSSDQSAEVVTRVTCSNGLVVTYKQITGYVIVRGKSHPVHFGLG